MSGYTIGEIVVWLVLAAAVGFALGWLLREIKCRAIHVDMTAAVAPPVTPAPALAEPVADVTPAKKTPAKKAPAKKAPAKKVPAKKTGGAAGAPDVEPGIFAGSAKPLTGGGAPSADYIIKGNESSMIYHPPGSPSYERMIAKTWFKTEADAIAAGFRKPRNA